MASIIGLATSCEITVKIYLITVLEEEA